MKKKGETGRISMAIPSKGDASTAAARGGVVETVQPSPKKRKISAAQKRRSLSLTAGATTAVDELEG
ncbi:hypothetical protein A2U01_0063610, partial [Trifolium medium]|nr:hypothetical protein [Trifolium medium]